MGAEQSKEEADATNLQFDADVNDAKHVWMKKKLEEHRLFKAAKEEKLARIAQEKLDRRAAQEKLDRAAQEKLVHVAQENKAVGQPKSALVRSSKKDAVLSLERSSQQPFTEDDGDDDEDGGVNDGSHVVSQPARQTRRARDVDVLSSWQPRKQPFTKTSLAPSVDEVTDDVMSKRAARVKNSEVLNDAEVNRQSRIPDQSEPRRKSRDAMNHALLNSVSAHKQKTTEPTLVTPEVKPEARNASARGGKRPMPIASADERRASSSKAPRLSSSASSERAGNLPTRRTLKKASAQNSGRKTSNTLPSLGEERPPRWYTALKQNNARKSDEVNAGQILDALKADIKRSKAKNTLAELLKIINSITRNLHIIPFEPVSGQLLRNKRMLHDADGLPQLFDARFSDGVAYPWYVKADAEELYNKWCMQIFETDLLRGIIRGKPKKSGSAEPTKNNDIIDPAYSHASARYFGNGLLLNGQWWPTQLAAYRDGAHGDNMKGIVGKTGEGAYSCLMSTGEGYENVDGGDIVHYCGTDGDDGTPSAGTRLLLDNEQHGHPVRFIRSHNVPSQWAPMMGFRYDGLYKVVNHEVMDPPGSLRQRHRFRLEREAGQDPIRGGDGPERRPTEQEADAHRKDKRLRGYT